MQFINLDTSKENIQKTVEFFLQWNNEDKSIFQQTSGSTGKPKTIEIPKWKMKASAKMTGEFLGLKNMKTALLCMNTDYIGAKMMIVRAIEYNLDLVVTEVNSNPMKNIDFPIDFAAMVPLQVEEIIKQNPEKLNLIDTLIIGGAAISNHLIEELQKFDCKAYSTFGMTETVSHIALRSLKAENEPYKVIGNTILSTENDCLIIDSEELGIERLKTNDIIELIDTKSFYWKGRADFVINSGGVKIHPEEVEEKIKNSLKIDGFIISSIPDERLGNRVVFIGEEQIKELVDQNAINEVLSKYERPAYYFYLPELLKTSSGKINRLTTQKAIL